MRSSFERRLPPRWTAGATRRDAFLRGIIESPSIPVVVVISTFLGFGALARDLGFSVGQSAFVSGTVFALPGQVVLVDQIGHGATLAAATFAVMLTAVRLLPMTVYLMPYLRDETTPRWVIYLLSHLVAITVWVESLRRLPPMPAELRVPYFASFATTVFLANIVATIVGYEMAAEVPPAIAAGLIFLSPIYFLLSLMASMQTRADVAALILGSILGPVIYLLAPGFDLLLTGVIGGSAAYALLRWERARQ